MRIPARQRGVALIIAVLVVAIVATVTVAMASRQQVDIRRSANLLEADLAYQAALAAETFAHSVMAEDDRTVDHLDEDWAKAGDNFIGELEGALVTGELTDLAGRFNLNNLLTETGDVSQADLDQFQRLLQVLGLNGEIANAVLDWLDEDFDTRSGGAEDGEYMDQTPSYRAANGPLVSPSELRLIKGISADDYALLLPHISTLPTRTKLNVNTASAEVLASLVAGWNVSQGQTLFDNRPESGYANVTAFLAEPSLANLNVDQERLAVNSGYFLAYADATFGRGRIQIYSVLSRDNEGVVTTVMRTQGVY